MQLLIENLSRSKLPRQFDRVLRRPRRLDREARDQRQSSEKKAPGRRRLLEQELSPARSVSEAYGPDVSPAVSPASLSSIAPSLLRPPAICRRLVWPPSTCRRARERDCDRRWRPASAHEVAARRDPIGSASGLMRSERSTPAQHAGPRPRIGPSRGRLCSEGGTTLPVPASVWYQARDEPGPRKMARVSTSREKSRHLGLPAPRAAQGPSERASGFSRGIWFRSNRPNPGHRAPASDRGSSCSVVQPCSSKWIGTYMLDDLLEIYSTASPGGPLEIRRPQPGEGGGPCAAVDIREVVLGRRAARPPPVCAAAV